MSDTKAESKGGGWFKAIIGTVAGLMSGAVMMWFSPFLDKVIKPAKPIANFAVEHTGLTVTFHNRSTGSGQVRWDFGDGSPLEFAAADQPTVTHTYAKAGPYQAKCVVANVLGEENERTVTIELTDGGGKASTKPMVTDLYVRPPGKVGQAVYAPATFQFEAQADNAQLYSWDFGDGNKNIHVGHDNQISHTFATAGTYTITLTAFNGKEKSQHDVTVDVFEPPTGMLSVNLKVADQGTQVEKRQREVRVSDAVVLNPRNSPKTVEKVIAASTGFELLSVERKQSQNQNIEQATWQIAPDRKTVRIIGKVVKPAGNAMAVLNEHLVITEQRKSKASRDPVPVVSTLNAPGNTALLLPPVPDDWTDVRRQYVFEVKQDNMVLWQGAQLPQNVPLTLPNGRMFTLVATTAGERVQVNLLGRPGTN